MPNSVSSLAIFDLDNTLLAGDSDHAWGEFLCANGHVDAQQHQRLNDQFYQAYCDGNLDIDAYLQFALSAIAIMVVPEKENWRHVFDLTRFRERPTKIDSSQYQMRVREAFLSKVRQFNDLTRDEFARKSPAEIMYMVKDPRLVELISSNRSYSNEELREVIPQIRRWGK